jgi:hypothetical protein
VHAAEPVVPVVKTLSDPPEIWDLVHEVPRNFDARSAFVSRIATMNRTVALAVCAGLILLVCCGVGMLVLTSSSARNEVTEIPPAPIAAQATVNQPVPQQALAENPPVEVANDNHVRSVPNKARWQIRQPKTTVSQVSQPVETGQSRAAAAVATPQLESPKPAPQTAKTTPVNPLSPHLISAPKDAPPKGKVIQWP